MTHFDLTYLALALIPFLLAITLHEAAHAYAAKRFGDNTAYYQGRVTLNPISHIDVLGTLILPALTIASTGLMFGWAKPVPVSFGKLRNPKVHSIYVAAAGPVANIIMIILWALLMLVMLKMDATTLTLTIAKMANIGIIMNVCFAIFNLLPVLPLDGGRMLEGLLPTKLAYNFNKIEPYGIWIVLLLAMSGAVSPLFKIGINFVHNIMTMFV